ncbi:MAG: nicotinamidase, partial [Chloracidobacterium sp.]
MPTTSPLPLPAHYHPSQTLDVTYAGQSPEALFRAATDWRQAHDLSPASADARRAHLLVIDMQVDFC